MGHGCCRTRHALTHPQPIFDETGRRGGALDILVDISDRKEMERALRESEGKYRALADRATMPMWPALLDQMAEAAGNRKIERVDWTAPLPGRQSSTVLLVAM